jgi:hypothetical protein
MTAGRGIVHSEAPLAESEAEYTMHGIQLWTSLPRALKSMAPKYQRIDATSIPSVAEGGATVRVIAGDYAGTPGPAETLMPLLLWHVSLDPGAVFRAKLPAAFEAAAYVVEGEGRFGDAAAGPGRMVVWSGNEGPVEVANSGDAKLELMVLGGAPAEGPLVFHGPFVMNSVEQVRAAEIAYRTGRMGVLDE